MFFCCLSAYEVVGGVIDAMAHDWNAFCSSLDMSNLLLILVPMAMGMDSQLWRSTLPLS